MSNDIRQPAGIPVGGQFTTHSRTESTVSLGATEVRDAAFAQYLAVSKLLGMASAKVIAEYVLDRYPQARYLGVKQNELYNGYYPTYVFDEDDNVIASSFDLPTFEDELDALPGEVPFTRVPRADGRFDRVPRPEYAWFVDEPGQERGPFTRRKIDLRAAANIDLDAYTV